MGREKCKAYVSKVAAMEKVSLQSQSGIHSLKEQAGRVGHADAQLTIRNSKKDNSGPALLSYALQSPAVVPRR